MGAQTRGHRERGLDIQCLAFAHFLQQLQLPNSNLFDARCVRRTPLAELSRSMIDRALVGSQSER